MNQNYIITVKKLFNGFVSIRSNIIVECIKKNQNLIIKLEGCGDADGYMGISLKSLKNPILFQIHTKTFNSKINLGQTYQLYEFYWVKGKGVKYSKK